MACLASKLWEGQRKLRTQKLLNVAQPFILVTSLSLPLLRPVDFRVLLSSHTQNCARRTLPKMYFLKVRRIWINKTCLYSTKRSWGLCGHPSDSGRRCPTVLHRSTSLQLPALEEHYSLRVLDEVKVDSMLFMVFRHREGSPLAALVFPTDLSQKLRVFLRPTDLSQKILSSRTRSTPTDLYRMFPSLVSQCFLDYSLHLEGTGTSLFMEVGI